MNRLEICLIILICFFIIVLCMSKSQTFGVIKNKSTNKNKLDIGKYSDEEPQNNIYIDNPYDLFYDPNYTTLFYEPWIDHKLNKPDGYGGTWSLGGSKFYPYHKTYINYGNPVRVISGNRMTRYGGRDPMVPPSIKNKTC
jgi:hypothetical protein